MTGIIVLAAGSSSRLGQPKQLISWKGIPLVRHSALVALEAGIGPVTVVLGAVVRSCREALDDLSVTIVENQSWSEGMGGSIARGMSASEGLNNVIITLCDLPLITPSIYSDLLALRISGNSEVVASHNGTSLAPPILFSNNRFQALRSLKGPEGAKNLLRNETSLTRLDCPEAAIDIDTQEDLSVIRQSHKAGF